jgi:hypothetical protein
MNAPTHATNTRIARSLGLLGVAALLTVMTAGCAVSAEDDEEATGEDALSKVVYEVSETDATTSTRLVYGTYKKTVLVKASRPTTAKKVFAALMLNNATGANGLCPSCKSATPEHLQNDRHGRIHADAMAPGGLPLPEFLTGDVEFVKASETDGEIHMGSVTNGLSGKIEATQISPTEIQVEETGTTVGVFPETFAGLHNKYFDLRSALERHLR